MQSRLNPYIGFKDNTREAMDFYKTVFGGKLTMSTFKDGGMPTDPSAENLIMHALLEADNGMVLMASDTPPGMTRSETSNISVSLGGDNEVELRGYWDKLAESANITMPIAKAPWGDTFGMLTDKFGVDWMVNISAPKV